MRPLTQADAHMCSESSRSAVSTADAFFFERERRLLPPIEDIRAYEWMALLVLTIPGGGHGLAVR